MRIVSIVFCIIILVMAAIFIFTDHADALFDAGASRNPPLILVLILAIAGLWANLKKQY
jgi:choline-glycine betaine transporter